MLGFRDEVQMVVYLLPTGRFLYVGCWDGHEQSAAAGEWFLEGTFVHLRGKGYSSTDRFAPAGPRAFNLTYLLHLDESGRQLRGILGHWSLLRICPITICHSGKLCRRSHLSKPT